MQPIYKLADQMYPFNHFISSYFLSLSLRISLKISYYIYLFLYVLNVVTLKTLLNLPYTPIKIGDEESSASVGRVLDLW